MTIGLNDKECGQIGTITIAGTLGCTTEAPAAQAYAVLPVGVEMIKPEIMRITMIIVVE
jgi:hypothetical protein